MFIFTFDFVLIFISLIIGAVGLYASYLNYKESFNKKNNYNHLYNRPLSEFNIEAVDNEDDAYKILHKYIDHSFDQKSIYYLYTWSKDNWLLREEQYPKQMNIIRKVIMKYINYQHEHIEDDIYIKQIMAIINARYNQLPARLISDLLNMGKGIVTRLTINIKKYLLFHLYKLRFFEDNRILITYEIKEEMETIKELYKLSELDVIACRLSEEDTCFLEKIKYDDLNKKYE